MFSSSSLLLLPAIMSTAAVFGCTGAVGSQILATLLTTDAFPSIKTISRRLPSSQSPKLQSVQESNTSKWPAILSSLTPSVVFNALGTTRTAAGGTKYQWLIDHDLCIDNARAARDAGVKTYVFVSSGGTRWPLAGYFPYLKMKIGVEDAIQELGFDNAVILKPGVIIGRDSSNQKAPLVEKLIESLSQGIRDKIGADQTIIGRAAVAAARIVQEGTAPKRHWVLEQADILRLGRDEWKE